MLTSKEYALQYFDEKDDTLFALITPEQWLEFANQYGMYVRQNNAKLSVSGRSEQLRGEALEQKAMEALQEIHKHTTLCVDEGEEHIFICGYNAGYNGRT